jgi:phosphoglycolate phosphatase
MRTVAAGGAMGAVMHLLFDLDGTLTDPAEGITGSICHALLRLERRPPPRRELERYIGPPLRSAFADLMPDADEQVIARAIAFYRERYSVSGLYENTVYPGIMSALDGLARCGCRLRVVTSKPEPFARRIVAYLGLEDRFEDVHGAEMSGRLTDKAELVGHVVRAASLPVRDAWMIGDRCWDIIGGRAHGLRTAAVSWGYGDRAELETALPDVILDAPGDLLTLAG